jgi:predicted nucleic acid-binding Zn ribbon protein
MTEQLSGRDLARETLRQALADAKNRRQEPAAKKRPLRAVRRNHTAGDPVALGAALTQLMVDRGLEQGAVGGSVLDRWPQIAPELADHVRAVHYDDKRLRLHLQPTSPAFATQLNLFQAQLVKRINDAMGGRAVQGLQILRPTHTGGRVNPVYPGPAVGEGREFSAENPAPGWPGPTGAPASVEMREWRDTYRRERAARDTSAPPPSSPWFASAYGRLREPETVHAATVNTADVSTPEEPDLRARSAAAHARALAVARAQRRPGDPTTLRPAAGAA